MLTEYGNRHLVVNGFSISFLVYYSVHVCINISLLQGAKCAHTAGSNCSDLDVYYVV